MNDRSFSLVHREAGQILSHRGNRLLLIEAWESKHHQQVHIEQPHMEKMRSFKGEYIATTTLGEFELKG